MNPDFNSFDKINFDKLLIISQYKQLHINNFYKGAYLGYIDWLKFGEFTLICQSFHRQ